MNIIAPEIAQSAKPGQFIQVRTTEAESNDPILARPISIYFVRPDEGLLSIIFKVAGRGTRLLAAKQSGELLDVMGPVGNGFAIPKGVSSVALIAGGIGMPPLFNLAELWQGLPNAPSLELFYGGRSAIDLLALKSWSELGIRLHCATDDGSVGYHGLVTELFCNKHCESRYDYLIACGPTPMLRAIQTLAAREGIPGQISLEAYMACGVGACLGCACSTNEGYRRVCVDGPVFAVGEVVLT